MPAPVLTPLEENQGGALCSESLPCSETLPASDWQVFNALLEESGPAVACSETLSCSDTTVTCSDAGVGITPLDEET